MHSMSPQTLSLSPRSWESGGPAREEGTGLSPHLHPRGRAEETCRECLFHPFASHFLSPRRVPGPVLGIGAWVELPALHRPAAWPWARGLTSLGLALPTQATASPCCWTLGGSKATSPFETASSRSCWRTPWGGAGSPSWYLSGAGREEWGLRGGGSQRGTLRGLLPRWPACRPQPSAFLRPSAPCDTPAELSGSPLGPRRPR